MPEGAAATPLMEQYERVKAQYPGHLVLFRVGDFFETFGEDAKLLAREVEVVLTARSPDAAGDRIPMAGVPHHAVDTYLARLVRKGYKVALCDQVEDARFARGLVRREVTRVVTPGTVVEDRILSGPDHNFLASLVLPVRGPGAYACVDITTGEWFHGQAAAEGLEPLLAALAPFQPAETIVAGLASEAGAAIAAALRREFPRMRLEEAPPALPDSRRPAYLASAEPGSVLGEADGRLAGYLAVTQPRLVPFLELVEASALVAGLRLDAKTLRHLEVSRPMNPDDPSGPTLLGSWDETVTAPGRRTLAFWLRHPLAEVGAIRERSDVVESLVARGSELLVLRSALRPVPDLSRIAARIAGRRVRPPELAALREGLAAVAEVRAWLATLRGTTYGQRIVERLAPVTALAELLAAALPREPPATVDAGGLFLAGYDAELDRAAREENDALKELAALERTEQQASGIKGLRVGYNQVFGYYFDVTRPNLARVPAHFRRKQTLAGGERFTTDALGALETRILDARVRRNDGERSAWERFLGQLEPHIPAVHRLSRAVGELDTLATFALLAQERRLVRPEVDDSTVLSIRDGRHPVLDRTLDGQFVPNDVELSGADARLLVLTGPNMSGKSTYMRQVGLLVLLAQCGAFVPARYARVGVVSALCTRMGFTDEIGRGKSSFMVEMSEVAEILRAADDRALVLLDEVGRGTSTFDGLALAWGILRHLHDRVRCRTILATHYHQLTELVAGLPAARNAHLAVREDGQEIAFLHRLVPGSTDRSYGLHVARLAGLPPSLVTEADRLLQRLEGEGVDVGTAGRRTGGARYTQAILLASESPPVSEVEAALRALDPERMTPFEALAWLSEWRARLTGGGPTR